MVAFPFLADSATTTAAAAVVAGWARMLGLSALFSGSHQITRSECGKRITLYAKILSEPPVAPAGRAN
jgi:hypothetical protein